MQKTRAVLQLALIIVSDSASAHNLFDAVPAAQLRDVSTDRPATTESAYTVDAAQDSRVFLGFSYRY